MKTPSPPYKEAANVNASLLLESIREFASSDTPLDPVIRFTKHLPLFSGNILELHNNRNDKWFDFSFRINHLYDKPVLHENFSRCDLSLYIQEGYNKIVDTSIAGFRFGIENCWFEYDFPYQWDPSLFFDVHRSTVLTAAEGYRDLITLCRIFHYPCHPELEQFLIRLKENNLTVVFFGFMLSRNSGSIRLTIRGMQPYKMNETLKMLNWFGNYDLLKYLENNYINSDQKLLLDVDFDYKLGSRVGIEIFNFEDDWLLEKFRKNGVYAQDQHCLLKNWYGNSSLHPDLSALLTERYQRPVNTLYRRINHFKFSIQGDNITTKAYLYYCF